MQNSPLDGPPSRSPTGGLPAVHRAEEAPGRLPLFHVQVDEDTAGLREAEQQASADDTALADEDLAVYESLAAAEFGGVAWELFANTLAQYAHPIMTNWLYTGQIFAACTQRGRPVRRRTERDAEALRTDRDERDGLVCEAIARGLRVFQKHALTQGGWRPDGGASLKTYFIGAVVGEFGGVFDRWASERAREPACAPNGSAELGSQPTPHTESPESQTIGHDAVVNLLAQVRDDATRTALFLSISGYTMQEIGEHLHMSAAAVSMRLSRLRKNPPRQQGGPPAESDSATTRPGREDA
ncbi:RNA polymerase sigma factor [Streptomyces sp. NPDC048211]|uniref:RNA polymerase sigma factor n=1 Tax=Streptomyces sp. NPDC048211 TaxID=3365516 RepID=UPI0037134919